MPEFEILENLEILTKLTLDPTQLMLDGIRMGSNVSDFPRQRITECTLAKIAYSTQGGTDKETEYRDNKGRLLKLDQVIDSVFKDGGIAHFKSKLSYRIADGKVTSFSIRGEQLLYFQQIKTYEQCMQQFGTPDLVEKHEAYGELMHYDNYYYKSHKFVSWDCWDSKISNICIGDVTGILQSMPKSN